MPTTGHGASMSLLVAASARATAASTTGRPTSMSARLFIDATVHRRARTFLSFSDETRIACSADDACPARP
jgi:hypothetical protein